MDVDIRAEADTLDRIDVVYDVTLNLCINAGTYSGPLDADGIAALVESRGIQPEDVVTANIIEITLDDKVIARGVGTDRPALFTQDEADAAQTALSQWCEDCGSDDAETQALLETLMAKINANTAPALAPQSPVVQGLPTSLQSLLAPLAR